MVLKHLTALTRFGVLAGLMRNLRIQYTKTMNWPF
jgi:hypothetical protein